jgi:hypothetical protein
MIQKYAAVCLLRGRVTLKSQNKASSYGSDKDTLGPTSDETTVVDAT